MRLGDKLIQLRRERGYSQEQLANMLDVSRQSVSKWEAGQSIPEMNKLINISDLYDVTVDSLVRENIEILSADKRQEITEASSSSTGRYDYESARAYGFYEYKSKITILGIPLVHIKTGYGMQVAKGIIAIGNISIGLISIGGISVGGICLGGLAFGLLALAGLALGGIAIGGGAVGIFAMGGMAIGIYSVGGFALASEIALGGVAFGHTAIGDSVRGENTLILADNLSYGQIKEFILNYHPNIWKPLLRLLAFIGEIAGITRS